MISFRVLIVVALQTLALAYMIFERQQMLDSARVVTLKVVPVDPRDMFRGDYVVLNYDISRVDVATLAGDDKFSSGETAYVTVQKQSDGIWNAVAIAHKPVSQSPGDVALLATVQYADDPAANASANVSLTYGVESYFVPQGTGHAIEEEARKGSLTVDVAVNPQGRSAIRAVRRNGQAFYVEGVF
ncbi:MAG: GDYXXLXY domain-containing protein [Micropepsaceae bacterium]